MIHKVMLMEGLFSFLFSFFGMSEAPIATGKDIFL